MKLKSLTSLGALLILQAGCGVGVAEGEQNEAVATQSSELTSETRCVDWNAGRQTIRINGAVGVLPGQTSAADVVVVKAGTNLSASASPPSQVAIVEAGGTFRPSFSDANWVSGGGEAKTGDIVFVGSGGVVDLALAGANQQIFVRSGGTVRCPAVIAPGQYNPFRFSATIQYEAGATLVGCNRAGVTLAPVAHAMGVIACPATPSAVFPRLAVTASYSGNQLTGTNLSTGTYTSGLWQVFAFVGATNPSLTATTTNLSVTYQSFDTFFVRFSATDPFGKRRVSNDASVTPPPPCVFCGWF